MRELLCGFIIGLCCGIATGAWIYSKAMSMRDDEDSSAED